jgi:transposase
MGTVGHSELEYLKHLLRIYSHELPRRSKRHWLFADSPGQPVGLYIEKRAPHEVKLVDSTLVAIVVPKAPQNLVGDNALDPDKLDTELRQYGIEVIAPHRSNRKSNTQVGRRLSRYRRRWKIERLFAWLQNFRRLFIRYERHAENFLGMLHLRCCLSRHLCQRLDLLPSIPMK